MIIAVDGVSGSGKTTIAKKLAKELGFAFFSAGLFYRAITLNAILNNVLPQEDEKLINLLNSSQIELIYNMDGTNSCFLNKKDVSSMLNNEDISSKVALYSCKEYILDYVHALEIQTSKANKNIIMDGRDIGSVVFPKAELKLFVTCSAETRAKRRTMQLEKMGQIVNYNQIYSELVMRDLKDTTRKLCPLKKTEDAYLIDTSNITINQGVTKAMKYALRNNRCNQTINDNQSEAIVEYFANNHCFRALKK